MAVQDAETTNLSWPRNAAISLALAASQMRVAVSVDAVTMPSTARLRVAETTLFSWPCRTAISLGLAPPQLGVVSPDAVTMRDPSGLKAADRMTSGPRRTAISLPLAAA